MTKDELIEAVKADPGLACFALCQTDYVHHAVDSEGFTTYTTNVKHEYLTDCCNVELYTTMGSKCPSCGEEVPIGKMHRQKVTHPVWLEAQLSLARLQVLMDAGEISRAL